MKKITVYDIVTEKILEQLANGVALGESLGNLAKMQSIGSPESLTGA
ncbi:hypothetical protein [Paenibacillus sp. FSL W8-0194]